jgi:hypothetical protein
MGQRARRRPALETRLESEMDLGVRGHELRVVRLELRRLAEDAAVELDRLREVRDVQGDVDRSGHDCLHFYRSRTIDL